MRCVGSVISPPCNLPRQCRSVGGEVWPEKQNRTCAQRRSCRDRCHLWLPSGSIAARALAWGFMPLLAKGGLLSTPPRQLSDSMWPEALRGSALAVYALAEPVVATGSLLDALARPHRKWIFSYDASDLQFAGGQVEIADALFQPRSIVFAAGEGNAELMRRAGIRGDLMQRRPLKMVLLRGTTLPVLFGHCIMRGKTQLTITTPTQGIWQVGGEIAEQLARQENLETGRQVAMTRSPGLPTWAGFLGRRDRYLLSDSGRSKNCGTKAPKWRPRVARRSRNSCWLAHQTLDGADSGGGNFRLGARGTQTTPGHYEGPLVRWPTPRVARYPWEVVKWFPAR